MNFQEHHLYHIYNQGNNKQTVFFSRSNYLFFLNKIRTFVLPYADILAWCLMPNHFHLMVYVKTLFNRENEDLPINEQPSKRRNFNQSIGIMLRSYTRAINKQENRTGSLFRKETKAECITCFKGLTPNFINTKYGTTINLEIPEKQYPQICFNYIHENPVKAGLVAEISDWEFSSASDFYGNRNGKLINKQRAKEFINFN